MSAPIIPPEILEEVLNHLSRDRDRSFLRSLCLVSRDIRDVCQRILFSSLDIVVDIADDEGKSRLQRLQDTIQSNTRLANHVHEVQLTVLQPHEFYKDQAQTDVLANILEPLGTSAIHTLRIPFVASKILAWNDLGEGVQTALLRIINNPAFKTLSVATFMIPSNFFDSINKIADLEFIGLLIDGFSLSSQQPPIQKTCQRQHHISRLKVFRPLPFQWRKTVACISTDIGLCLDRLEYFALSSSDSRYTDHFFELSSLKEIWVGDSHWSDNNSTFTTVALAPPLRLSRLTSLVSLSICGRYYNLSRHLFNHLKKSLSSFPHSHPSLRYISFGIETSQAAYNPGLWPTSHELFEWLASFCDQGQLFQVSVDLWFPVRTPEAETDAWKEETEAEALKWIAWKGPKDTFTLNIQDFNVFPMWA